MQRAALPKTSRLGPQYVALGSSGIARNIPDYLDTTPEYPKGLRFLYHVPT
jgi:hypothetical protein